MATRDVKLAIENLTCPVCYQLFKNPKYLPCYHSYCEYCLEKMKVESRILCPECRKEAVIPEGGVKNFENNFFINRLVDQLVLNRKVEGDEEVRCDECEENESAMAYCPDCNLFFCDIHEKGHKRNKNFHRHEMVSLTELRSKKNTPIHPKPIAPLCNKHNLELLFYCETCEELICVYCTVKEHNGHKHDTVKEVAKNCNFVRDVSTTLVEMVSELSTVCDDVHAMQQLIVKQGKEIESRIDEYYDHLSQKLIEQKDELKQQLRDMLSYKEKAGMSQLKRTELGQKEMLKMKDLSDASESSSDQEKLSVRNQLFDQMKEMLEKYENLNIPPIEADTMTFTLDKELFPLFGQLNSSANAAPVNTEIIDLPGYALKGNKVEFSIITRDASNCLCSRGGSKVSVELESTTKKTTFADVKDNENGSYMASFVARQFGDIKLSVSVDGIPTTKAPFTVVVHKSYSTLDKQGIFVTNDVDMGKLWGVAVNSKGTWAVTDCSKHYVYMFDQQNNLVKQFGGDGTKNGQFRSPKGVAFDSHNHLYVADFDNHRVQHFDEDGNYVSQFGSGKAGSDVSNLSCPVGITVHINRVYIADSNNKRISVFHINGYFCLEFGSEQLGCPNDVAVHDHQVFVADYFHHCIYQYSLDGNYTGKLTTPTKYKLNSPCSVATDLMGYLFVANTWNQSVLIFDKSSNYQYLHCFGRYGSSTGQFKYPHGIAIGPTGSIYIIDQENQRIQIFSNY